MKVGPAPNNTQSDPITCKLLLMISAILKHAVHTLLTREAALVTYKDQPLYLTCSDTRSDACSTTWSGSISSLSIQPE